MGLILRRDHRNKSRKRPRVSGGKRIDPTPEQIAKFESDYAECLRERDTVLVVIGGEQEREDYIQTLRTWGTDRPEGRVTVRLYEHNNSEPESTYYRLMPFVRTAIK